MSRIPNHESDAQAGREDVDQSERLSTEVTSSTVDTGNCSVRRRSSSSITPTTQPMTSSNNSKLSSAPATSPVGATTSAETPHSCGSSVFTPHAEDLNPTIQFEGQQSTSHIGSTTSTTTCVPPFGGKTPTSSHNSEWKCQISYIGSKKSTNFEKKGSTSHFGATASRPTSKTSIHYKESRSHFGGTVPKTTTTTTRIKLNTCERSRTHFGATVPKPASTTTTTTTRSNNLQRSTGCGKGRSTNQFGGTVPKTTSTSCEKRRSTTHFGSTAAKTPSTTPRLNNLENKNTPCYVIMTRRSPSRTTTNMDDGCKMKCSVSYIGRPLEENTDVVLDVGPCLGSDEQQTTSPPSEVPKAASNDDVHQAHSCRICHDDKPDEPLISPCRCKGTIANVHHSCLARWLGQDLTRGFRCELCHFRYPVVEARRYTMLESIPVWARDPQNRERFCSFMCVSGFITVINLVVYVTAILVMRYTALSTAPEWFVVCMFLFLVLLYLWNLVQCFKDTIFDHWYWWWHNCVNVRLDVALMADAEKTKESSEEGPEDSGSCESLQSCQEACAIDLTTRPVRI